MIDQLYLSIWLTNQVQRRRQFEQLLRLFPFSQREQPQSTVTIQAVSEAEPPLLEKPLNGPLDVDAIVGDFRDYQSDDVALKVESWWDLWQYDSDWVLKPARIEVCCLGPSFEGGRGLLSAERQEDLRIDFGIDAHFLPQPDVPASGRLVESNIRSLLRLVHELDRTIPMERRLLWTESGENFAERLQQVLMGTAVQ